jgi:hypothetical protein
LEQQFKYQIKQLSENNSRHLKLLEEGMDLRLETMKDDLTETITKSIELSPLKNNFIEKNEIEEQKLTQEMNKAENI